MRSADADGSARMPIFRRQLLQNAAAVFAMPALAEMLSAQDDAASPPQLTPRIKRVIFLFMYGGPSSIDTFDYKPQLKRDHGKPLADGKSTGFLQAHNRGVEPDAFVKVADNDSQVHRRIRKCLFDIVLSAAKDDN
jgi:hypothetical protein